RLIDLSDNAHELFYHTHRKGVVLIAAGERLENLAPFVSDLNALHADTTSRNIEVWVILSDTSTPRRELLVQAQALGLEPPVLLDRELLANHLLDATFATEAVLVRAPDFVTVYRGAIREGNQTPLNEAVQALADGRAIDVWRTAVQGPPLSAMDGNK